MPHENLPYAPLKRACSAWWGGGNKSNENQITQKTARYTVKFQFCNFCRQNQLLLYIEGSNSMVQNLFTHTFLMKVHIGKQSQSILSPSFNKISNLKAYRQGSFSYQIEGKPSLVLVSLLNFFVYMGWPILSSPLSSKLFLQFKRKLARVTDAGLSFSLKNRCTPGIS